MTAKVEHVKDAPQQRNGYDCGMYTVLVAERLASRKKSPGNVANSRSKSNPPTAAATPAIKSSSPATSASSGSDLHSVVEDGGVQQDETGKQRKRKASPGVKSGFLEGVDVPVEGGGDISGLGEVSVKNIAPDFVSEARRIARERLMECIRADR